MKEEELLKKRLMELCEKAYNQNIYTYTHFLNEYEQSIYPVSYTHLDLHYMQIFRSVSLENNIGEILCCEIIDCRITISNLFLTYLY